MEREILFRGKCKGIGWKYGDLGQTLPTTAHVDGFSVDPATVGQYTGLTDRDGNKIFEGDILRNPAPNNGIGIVKWNAEAGWWEFWSIKMRTNFTLGTYADEKTIIGNIHDNPELLEVTK